jgi:hypothetical protein
MKLSDLREGIWDKEPNLNWADESNAERANNFDSPNLVLLNCSIRDVFDHGPRGFTLDLDDPTGGKYKIGNRVEKAIAHFREGKPMDPPEVGYNSTTKTIDFGNGRHRCVAAHQFGAEYIPMFVSTDGLEEFKKLVHIR